MTLTYHEWETLTIGSHGGDVMRLQQLLAGGNRYGYNAQPGTPDGTFGERTADAVKRYKWFVGYPKAGIIGAAGQQLRGYMVVRASPAFTPLTPIMALRKRRRRGTTYRTTSDTYPLAVRGHIIGIPYVGTHLDFHNWESDNAIDISAPTGTRVFASISGTIGPQWGALDTGGDPHLLGLRIHIANATQELYYAHCSRLIAKPGQHVSVGDVIGLSGSANGVQHLHFATHHGDPAVLIGLPPSPGYVDRHYPG
jgi:murein DD-endopeptidase MepM/ murein hydrolase activator NlpD